MKTLIKKFFDNEVLSYLFFGVATTVVSVVSRMLCYEFTVNELLATIIGDVLGILFAFVTNDTIVFKQVRSGWPSRLIKFFTARLATMGLNLLLTFIFVTSFPQIIGQFVNNNIKMVNTIETFIAQVLIIVLNYVFSKIFVFKNKKKWQQISLFYPIKANLDQIILIQIFLFLDLQAWIIKRQMGDFTFDTKIVLNQSL